MGDSTTTPLDSILCWPSQAWTQAEPSRSHSICQAAKPGWITKNKMCLSNGLAPKDSKSGPPTHPKSRHHLISHDFNFDTAFYRHNIAQDGRNTRIAQLKRLSKSTMCASLVTETQKKLAISSSRVLLTQSECATIEP